MTPILGLDLGMFKSLACFDDPATTDARFLTVTTDPNALRSILQAGRPDLVVFETGTIAGGVANHCDELGLTSVVANRMHSARSWCKLKRKTDRDDARKLARMAAIGELSTVPMPSPRARQYRIAWSSTATASSAAAPPVKTASGPCARDSAYCGPPGTGPGPRPAGSRSRPGPDHRPSAPP